MLYDWKSLRPSFFRSTVGSTDDPWFCVYYQILEQNCRVASELLVCKTQHPLKLGKYWLSGLLGKPTVFLRSWVHCRLLIANRIFVFQYSLTVRKGLVTYTGLPCCSLCASNKLYQDMWYSHLNGFSVSLLICILAYVNAIGTRLFKLKFPVIHSLAVKNTSLKKNMKSLEKKKEKPSALLWEQSRKSPLLFSTVCICRLSRLLGHLQM